MTKLFIDKILSSGRGQTDQGLRGYIEGYYGRLLTWPERRDILDHLHKLKMDAYLYAPKEDSNHRRHWRQDYDAEWQDAFTTFCRHAKAKQISVIAGIAPGLDYDFSHHASTDKGKESDWEILVRKCQMMLDCGADTIALLLDDIQPDLTQSADMREGIAHATLANKLNKALAAKMNTPLWLTPRIYADEMMDHDIMQGGADDEAYWPDLAQTLDDDIMLLVCGRHVVAHDTSLENTAMVKAGIAPSRAVIWDNLYAHDYCPRRLYLGSYDGRDAAQHLMLNPTGMVRTDQYLLSVMHESHHENTWEELLKTIRADHGIPDAFEVVTPFFNHPPRPDDDTGAASPMAKPDIMLAALDTLLWEWKSELAREWYPYLMGLRQDIMLTTGQMDGLRLRKSYPPLLHKPLSDDD